MVVLRWWVLIITAALGLTASPIKAQTFPINDPEAERNRAEIVVTAPRILGSAIDDIPPEITINEDEIEGYGASTLSDLLTALAPQTQSGRGRGGGAPVILVNGRRISGFAEIRDLPAEAILRVEVLPEEAALRYGFSADQRVTNFILRPGFSAITVEADYGLKMNLNQPSPKLAKRGASISMLNIIAALPSKRMSATLTVACLIRGASAPCCHAVMN
jgi:outer membrane cobalamin receptor